MIRAHIKRLVEATLVRAGPASLARLGIKNRVLVLAYHNVVPEGTARLGERSLHLPLGDFCRQLDELVQHFRVLPLEQALARSGNPGDDRAVVCLTFDDAYRGAITSAVPALTERGIPATIFVPPGLLGGGAFWWDRVAGEVGSIDEKLRDELLRDRLGLAEEVATWAIASGWRTREVPDALMPASEEELAGAVARGGITLGAHSWSHPNLTALAGSLLTEELAKPLDWLRERFPAETIPWIAYPYGLGNAAVRTAAREAGYTGAVMIEGGWFLCKEASRFAVPRLNVPAGLSSNGFTLRLAGLFGR